MSTETPQTQYVRRPKMNLKNMTEEERIAHKRELQREGSKRYYDKIKDNLPQSRVEQLREASNKYYYLHKEEVKARRMAEKGPPQKRGRKPMEDPLSYTVEYRQAYYLENKERLAKYQKERYARIKASKAEKASPEIETEN